MSMIHTIVIEDEKPALENLIQIIREMDFPIEVRSVLSSVRQAIDYLSVNKTGIDLILSDVQLGDGLSFNLFKEVEVTAPVIFITGYDEFIMNALEHNGIDYLLKPVSKKELSKALQKFQMLRDHFAGAPTQPFQNFIHSITQERVPRIMVKKGLEFVPLRLADVVLFYTENKIVFVLDKDGGKYLSDKTLGELEDELDPRLFFRANRQYIINFNFIKSYKVFEKLKLQVNLTLASIKRPIIISQETAPQFKRWVSG